MNFKKLGALLGLFLFLFGVMALAQATPTPVPVVPDQDLNTLFGQILSAFASGKVAAGVAGVVVAATFLFRKVFVDTNKVGSGALPWVSIALGLFFGWGSNVLLGATAAHAAAAMLLSGPLASTIWSSLLKLVVKKPA